MLPRHFVGVHVPESPSPHHPLSFRLKTKLSKIAENIFKKTSQKILSLKPDAQKIADIGTGSGLLSIALAKQSGKEIYAVDISPNILKKESELADKAGVKIQTGVADCKKLPFKDKDFDLVSSTNLIHMLDDAVPLLAELKRVIKPGGKAYIQGYRRNVNKIYRQLFNFHSNVILKNKQLDGMGPVINASFTKEELIGSQKKSGAKNFKVSTGSMLLKTEIWF